MLRFEQYPVNNFVKQYTKAENTEKERVGGGGIESQGFYLFYSHDTAQCRQCTVCVQV
jgi:hypothetical protein